jgi:hypothetical protein
MSQGSSKSKDMMIETITIWQRQVLMMADQTFFDG